MTAREIRPAPSAACTDGAKRKPPSLTGRGVPPRPGSRARAIPLFDRSDFTRFAPTLFAYRLHSGVEGRLERPIFAIMAASGDRVLARQLFRNLVNKVGVEGYGFEKPTFSDDEVDALISGGAAHCPRSATPSMHGLKISSASFAQSTTRWCRCSGLDRIPTGAARAGRLKPRHRTGPPRRPPNAGT